MKKCKHPHEWCLFLKSTRVDGILVWECIAKKGECKYENQLNKTADKCDSQLDKESETES